MEIARILDRLDTTVTLITLIAIKEEEIVAKIQEDQVSVLISETTLCLLQVLVMKKSLSFILLTNLVCHIKVENPFNQVLTVARTLKIMDHLPIVIAIILTVEIEVVTVSTIPGAENFTTQNRMIATNIGDTLQILAEAVAQLGQVKVTNH